MSVLTPAVPATAVGTAARRRAHTAAWSLLAAALLVLLTGIALGTGQVEMSVWEALRALVGLGDAGNVLVVQEFRAPRVVSALIAGAALAVVEARCCNGSSATPWPLPTPSASPAARRSARC